MKIEIEDKHIKEAEQIFIKGNEFDKLQRIPFIKNLETCDLLAVPGSGKTTALMAKLYCLSKQFPFKNGAGILVLAHTNSTVDEIEKELKKHCPNLFEYPNYVGTLQTFVNKFLANQACFEKYGSYINRNDDDWINDLITRKVFYNKGSKIFSFISNIIKSKNNKITKQFLVENDVKDVKELLLKYNKIGIINDDNVFGNIKENYSKIINSDLSQKEKTVLFNFNNHIKLATQDILNFKSVIKEFRYLEKEECFFSNDIPNKRNRLNFSTPSGNELKLIYDELRNNGDLLFYNSFELANEYLLKYPNIKTILKERFSFVFIDEMQDLEKHQIDIVENIFFDENSKTIIQRIGDPNQSIYNKVKDECDWKPRKIKYLNGSNRLSAKNAELVNHFTHKNEDEKFIVVGERKLSNDEKEIHPHLVLFTKDTKEQLKSKFEEIIKSHNLHNIEEKKKGFKIIGWTGERTNEGDGNLSLHTIFGYNKLSKTKKEDFDSLSKYLQLFNQEKETLEAVRKSILNAFIAILRFEDKKMPKKIRGKNVERFFTKSDLIEYIKNHSDNEVYDTFKDKLFGWCFDLVSKKNYRKTFNSVKDFIENEFKDWFNLELNPKTQLFIFEYVDEMKIKNKKIVEDDLGIEVTTVHSVKGQTNCATMYVETAYKTPVYETLKLKEASKNKSIKKQEKKTIPLFKQKQSCETPTGIEALKMMYVGFSRPTHLLCFAVLEENVKDDLEKYKNADWVIIDDLVKK
ncbi:ATP-dependent helicase [Flavobacterium columnare]|uniref:DNA 3'-5' helicase II n=1 Tax=Flavobacterium columnare TaxID=996 RepID=A0A437U891_9FLAO|nr:UvrD-helicase domain-containing protein [Flavobacterium columnare]RVU89833.1 ATP-dependent helicase [Flavobacterium columnare]